MTVDAYMNWPDNRSISSSRISIEGHCRGIYARRRCVDFISSNLSVRNSRMTSSGMYDSSSAMQVDNSHNKPELNAREICCSGWLEKRKMSGRWCRCSAVAKTSLDITLGFRICRFIKTVDYYESFGGRMVVVSNLLKGQKAFCDKRSDLMCG